MSQEPPTEPRETPRASSRQRVFAFVRHHAFFLVLLTIGAALRVLTTAAYRPAIQFIQDSYDYLRDARGFAPGLVRPYGYPAFLKLVSVTGRLDLVVVVQHLLGLVTAALLYALLRRLGVRSWIAALAAAPVLLDGYQVYIEHFILSESLFEFLLVTALVLILWSERPSPLTSVAAGTAFAAAGLTRNVGLLLVIPALVLLVVRRVGLLRVGCFAAAVVVLVGGYATWFHASHDRFALGSFDGYWLAGRVLPFADCRRVELTAAQRVFCDDRPVGERPSSDWYVWQLPSHMRRPEILPGEDRNRVAGQFARRIIRSQPGDYLRTIGRDVLHYFTPGRWTGRGDFPVQGYQFRTSYVPEPWFPQIPPPSPYVGAWLSPGPSNRFQTTLATYGFDFERLKPSLNEGIAEKLRGYQRLVYTPGPLLAGSLLVALLAGIGRVSLPHRRMRQVAWLLVAEALILLVLPAATAVFDYRYLLPTLAVLPPAAAIGATVLLERWQAWKTRER